MSNEQPRNAQESGLHHLHTRGHATYNMTGVSPSTSVVELYPYKPLNFDTHEIRLLLLYMTTNETIFCSLENVSLIDAKPYFALSYCWGDPRITERLSFRRDDEMPDGRIQVSVCTAIITASLARAIRAVGNATRKKRMRLGFVYLWVDALCINQNDAQERSQQVRNMRQIYSRADEVFSWVGPIDRTRMSEEALGCFLALPDWGNPYISLAISEAASVFFGEQYWRRVWVIQEITVATKATILYGEHKFRWDDVATVLRELQNTELPFQKRFMVQPTFYDSEIDILDGTWLVCSMLWRGAAERLQQTHETRFLPSSVSVTTAVPSYHFLIINKTWKLS